jgi:hypothetical protein
MKFRFTEAALEELRGSPKGPVIHFDQPAASGRGNYSRGFAIRVTPAGTRTFLLVYVAKANGRERRLVIGEHGPVPRLSLAVARDRAASLRGLVDSGCDPWQEAKERRAAAEEAETKSRATLAALMGAYVAHLVAAGKPSAREIADSFERNIVLPFPRLAALTAERASVDEMMPALRRLTREGKWRAAEKLASYLRSAFNAAIAAATDAGAHAFDGFSLRANPLAALKVMRPAMGANAGDHELRGALSELQLRHYWQAISKLDTPQGALMRFHLLSGAQRMEQLSRLTIRDLDLEGEPKTVVLHDTKGRRMRARRHVVPLLPEAISALARMRPPDSEGVYLFSVSDGARAAVPHTLAAAMREISGLLMDQGLIDFPVTPGAIRRTVETRLAAARISQEVRAQLQSHGLGGVQARHYDRHNYLDEKYEALLVLRDMLEPASKVTSIRSSSRKRVAH